MSYQPIENYGMIGNMHTVALVGLDGSIDWFCYPQFDSPSIFGAILDDQKGGRYKIAPINTVKKRKQFYWPDTNVLVTRFISPDGVGELTDYMPVGLSKDEHGYLQLVRRVSVVHGSITFRVECDPAFNYARDEHRTEIHEGGVTFSANGLTLGLATPVVLQKEGNGVVAEFTLEEGESISFVLHKIDETVDSLIQLSNKKSEQLFKRTIDYWHKWMSQCTYKGRWREQVNRSALALKLMTFEPTGAIVAAPTCSLPESIGGGRNWDYRYTWIRDGAFTIYALMRIGFTEEAARFMDWLEQRCHELTTGASLQTMYTIDGKSVPDEEVLDHLDGYLSSKPVRIGNGANNQLQLDIYGELMDSVYLFNKYGTPISYDLWTDLRKLANWVADHWKEKDEGIWEVRGGKQHFLYSKVMCWVALDRAYRLSIKRSFPGERDRWVKERDKIYEEIMQEGWSEERQAFVQHYGSTQLDAANLIMPLVFFISPSDPMMLKTLEATNKTPKKGGLVSNSFVYRYNSEHGIDGLEWDEGTFNICTFWLVEALTRAGWTANDPKLLNEARLIFEQMLGFANHVGLYSEETGQSGEALGNFPQAFTHLAIISAAYNLDRAIGKGS